MERNNIFNFATSELSQDAFICWCLNWLNYEDSELRALAVDLLKEFGEEDVSDNQEIIIKMFDIIKNYIIIALLTCYHYSDTIILNILSLYEKGG